MALISFKDMDLAIMPPDNFVMQRPVIDENAVGCKSNGLK